MALVLEGRSAIVTGASSGIGRASALAFAAAGARVTLVDRDEAGGVETLAFVRAAGGEAQFVAADVGSEAEVAAAVAAAVRAYGKLDCAFNNAGIVSNALAAVADCELGEWERLIRVNLTGPFLCMKYEIRAMLDTGGGAIVNTASNLAEVGQYNMPAYCASKAGVIGLTKATALDYARRNVRVNAVMPGVIETPMVTKHVLGMNPDLKATLVAQHPIGRFGKPEEVANAAVWLCSDGASFITGHALAIDGGYLAI